MKKRDWCLEDQERTRYKKKRVREKQEKQEPMIMKMKDGDEATVKKYLFVFDTCVSIN